MLLTCPMYPDIPVVGNPGHFAQVGEWKSHHVVKQPNRCTVWNACQSFKPRCNAKATLISCLGGCAESSLLVPTPWSLLFPMLLCILFKYILLNILVCWVFSGHMVLYAPFNLGCDWCRLLAENKSRDFRVKKSVGNGKRMHIALADILYCGGVPCYELITLLNWTTSGSTISSLAATLPFSSWWWIMTQVYA